MQPAPASPGTRHLLMSPQSPIQSRCLPRYDYGHATAASPARLVDVTMSTGVSLVLETRGQVSGGACVCTCAARPGSQSRSPSRAPGDSRCAEMPFSAPVLSINLQFSSQTRPAVQTSNTSLLPFHPQMSLRPCFSQPVDVPVPIPAHLGPRGGQAGLPATPLWPGSHPPHLCPVLQPGFERQD